MVTRCYVPHFHHYGDISIEILQIKSDEDNEDVHLRVRNFDLIDTAVFFRPIGTGIGTHSIGENSVKKQQKTKNMFDSYFHKFRLPYFVSILNLRVFGDNFLNSVPIFLLV